MATHDYVLDNATGANFRADLNLALAAIVSNNSNSSAPSTTYAYQWWADTTANILKIRNSANDAWISLFTLAGGPAFPIDGTINGLAIGKGGNSVTSNTCFGKNVQFQLCLHFLIRFFSTPFLNACVNLCCSPKKLIILNASSSAT